MSAPNWTRISCFILLALAMSDFAYAQNRPKARKPHRSAVKPPAETLPIDPERDVLPRAMLALALSKVVYLLPDLDSKKTALQSREYFTQFKQQLPGNLTLLMSESDPKTGLRVAAFKPVNAGATNLFIAIAGTEGFRDGIADLSFGRSQSQHLLEVIDDLFASNAIPKNPEIILTGHSLGGGLAQTVAWYLKEKLPLRNITPKIWLFTWNSFGAQELIRKQEPTFTASQVQLTYAANYFVSGEPVSKIGTHIGPTFALAPLEAETKKSKISFLKMDGMNRHKIETITEIVESDPMILIKSEETKTERKFYTSLLTGVMDKTSAMTKHLPKLSFSITSKKLPEVLMDLFGQITGREAPTREDREYFDWLETTTLRLFPALETKTKNVFADLINAKTEALMRFYDLKVVRAAKQNAANIKRVLKKEFE